MLKMMLIKRQTLYITIRSCQRTFNDKDTCVSYAGGDTVVSSSEPCGTHLCTDLHSEKAASCGHVKLSAGDFPLPKEHARSQC